MLLTIYPPYSQMPIRKRKPETNYLRYIKQQVLNNTQPNFDIFNANLGVLVLKMTQHNMFILLGLSRTNVPVYSCSG